jgi:hypothetical protein
VLREKYPLIRFDNQSHGEINRRSRGFTPWFASPSRGEREIILQTATENKRIEKKEDFNRAYVVIDPMRGCPFGGGGVYPDTVP